MLSISGRFKQYLKETCRYLFSMCLEHLGYVIVNLSKVTWCLRIFQWSLVRSSNKYSSHLKWWMSWWCIHATVETIKQSSPQKQIEACCVIYIYPNSQRKFLNHPQSHFECKEKLSRNDDSVLYRMLSSMKLCKFIPAPNIMMCHLKKSSQPLKLFFYPLAN